MGRAYVDHATGVRIDPAALAPAAGKFDNVQFVTVDHRHHQVAVVRDRFIGADVAPHAMAFRTQRKFRIDVEQNACASDVQLIMPWEAGRLVLRFLRGKVRGGRFGFPHSVGCSNPQRAAITNRLPTANVTDRK